MKFPLMRNNILREDLDAVIEHLKQDDPILTQSLNVRAFESEWSQWLGAKHSVFVNSGASANLLSMAILRIHYPEGGEVTQCYGSVVAKSQLENVNIVAKKYDYALFEDSISGFIIVTDKNVYDSEYCSYELSKIPALRVLN